MCSGGAMPKRANAPLTYVLAVMRFPKILDAGRLAAEFQVQVRAEYPLESDLENQGIEISIGQNGPEIRTEVQRLWQFSDQERGHALMLGSDFLLLHSGGVDGAKPAYTGHRDFIQRFVKAVEAFCRVIGPNPLMSALGYRYIDLVVPRPEEREGLADYLKAWALPHVPDFSHEGASLVDSYSVVGFRTGEGVLRFQALRNPPSTLPPELTIGFVNENRWVAARPADEFALLDIDHAVSFGTHLAIEPATVQEQLVKLSRPCTVLFEKAVTPHAEDVWR